MSVLQSRPPAAWFSAPEPDEPQPIALQPDRRFTGHAFTWADSGSIAPRDVTFDLFHSQPITTAEGGTLNVGAVLLDPAPVDLSMTASEAIAHYRSTGVPVAHIRAVEGAIGLWLSGVAAPEADEHLVATARQRELSGSWWWVDGRWSLVSIFTRPQADRLGLALLLPAQGTPAPVDWTDET